MIAAAIFVLAGITVMGFEDDLRETRVFVFYGALTLACFALAVLCAVGVLA